MSRKFRITKRRTPLRKTKKFNDVIDDIKSLNGKAYLIHEKKKRKKSFWDRW